MFGLGKDVPVKQQTTGRLWFDIVLFSAIGVFFLVQLLPCLLPVKFSGGFVALLGLLLFVEVVIAILIKLGAVELLRRRREK